MRRTMKQFIASFSIIILMFILISCNGDMVGPSVKQSDAIKIAKDNFNVKTVDKVELRHLTSEEINSMLSEETKKLTPVYFVIQGINDDQKDITVFVNSNNETIIYSKK
jgi:uncharacterized protein YpmB